MASLGGNNTLALDGSLQNILAGVAFAIFGSVCISKVFSKSSGSDQPPSVLKDALESFYKKQARRLMMPPEKVLLPGDGRICWRFSSFAALSQKRRGEAKVKRRGNTKRIWVDVGGGTGWNIEAMSAYVNVPEFFSSVYLVDFSPSLCDVARKRFQRLGWDNVKVICEDARKFRLEDHEDGISINATPLRSPVLSYFSQKRPEHGGADLVTMSYSLSMIPDYHSVIDSLTSLLSPNGVLGVVDFYVQSHVDFSFRNFTGGLVNRHVSWLSRTFWRAWFDIDRVGLEAARRDYLEYKFGTILNINARNKTLGRIPYYVWVGCHKKPFSSSALPHEIIEKIDALATESPLLYPVDQRNALTRAIEKSAPEIRSKAFMAAIQNLSANLPLPSFFYQNHHWRIYYDDQLQKHKQFNDEYIYAFTWEDTRVDERLLKLGADDVVLAITSAGDNILSYAMQSPARIHAVDLNPTQNHLLELKVASYCALPYEDFWRLFGDGKHPDFRTLLMTKLSPHLSSRAFQYWLQNIHVFTNKRGYGLYDTGGSRHAIRVFRWITRIFGVRRAVAEFLDTKTLNEQREVWRTKIRPALLSKLLCNLVVSQESFLWSALGVPKNQLAMIEADHAVSDAVKGPSPKARDSRSHAIWHYMLDTLDPVAEQTHIAVDNPYYHTTSQKKAHARLSRPGALDGLRIHTDELDEVISRITPGTLTVAVVMDSMDWFDPGAAAAAQQITKLNRALRMGGRVLLRSSALHPWYVKAFEAHGFTSKRVGAREGGACIDRVNMYASCWILTKAENLPPPTPEMDRMGGAQSDVTSFSL
ncbi:conserved hypothetical protein [Verticillium alfalfae VaMs.102]|uniref:Betaine lipid synthase n=1 Tax=Verticillium alfalfae (strain VaMs.102 / ATCC MYA-4576 / FGSC 10136) TaxID=526221 RepID=C9SGV8_VERA1|nr:conserved hypothetical protein [Verticillium alfalfae VaMs.102]EEY17580.1 conserved hypothetical protein [Verticillium alfalfae VaMs.102]